MAAWMAEHGSRLRQISDECHQLFLKSQTENNREQFEAMRDAHDQKAAEYHSLWNTRPQ